MSPIVRALVVATVLIVVGLVSPGTTLASCENMIQAQSRELWFIYGDVYPVRLQWPGTPASESTFVAARRSMWDAMARGLATAVACQRRINSDAKLVALLRHSRIYLAKYGKSAVQRASEADRSLPAAPDSLFDLFGGLDHDSTALLYTIRIGSFVDSVSAHRLVTRFGWLDDLRRNGDEWDSTMVLDWNHQDCSVGDYDRPTLFVLTPVLSGTGRWSVLSGLFVGRRDADHRLLRIRRRGGSGAKVVPIRVTGAVLSRAIPPS